jgi:hypothetical protein
MTSFPVYGDLLISPLSHDLIDLGEKEKLIKDYRSMPMSRGGLESLNILPIGSDSRKADEKVLGEKKTKSLKRNDLSAELTSCNSNGAWKGNGFISKKEPDIDMLTCEELISKTLKLPLLSNSNSADGDMEKGKDWASYASREANMGLLKAEEFSELPKEEPLGPTFSQEDVWFEKSKAGSAGKFCEDKKASSLDDISVYPKKAAHPNREKSYDSVKSDSNIYKGRKALNTELTDPLKEKANQKATVHEPDSIRLPPEKEHPL